MLLFVFSNITISFLCVLKTTQQTDLLYFQLCYADNSRKQFPQFDTSFLLLLFS